MNRTVAVGLVGVALAVGVVGWALQHTSSPVPRTITVDRTALDAMVGYGGLSTSLSRSEERALLPQVTEVETWQQVSASFISEEQNFAPGIVQLSDGTYRIYWNDYERGGITSATSADGINFTPDDGIRLTVAHEGTECVASHPWLVALEDGYRMYYNTACTEDLVATPAQQIYTAFSKDGLTFEREGMSLGNGEATGLTYSGHGRIAKLDDSTYRMYFSANTVDMPKMDPSAILGATSKDGLRWTLDEALTFEMGHDPSVVWVDGMLHMYTSFLSKNILHLVSEDGYTFTPVAWIEVTNKDGRTFEEFGDVEVMLQDGEVVMYGGGKLEGDREGYPGLIAAKRVR